MHIFITGGTRGIGLGIVTELLKKGHQVTYTGTSEKSIQENIGKLQGDYHPVICDVRSTDDLLKAKNEAQKTFGPIDIWINNAGVGQEQKTIDQLSDTEIGEVIDINLLGTMIGTKIALEQFKKQGYGYVYNVEGLGSNNMKIPKTIVYGTSKRAITYFSKAANKELTKYPDIFVGTIQPGMVYTDLLLSNMSEDGMKIARILGEDVEDVAPFIVKKILKKKQSIKYLTFIKVLFKFLFSPFIKHKEI